MKCKMMSAFASMFFGLLCLAASCTEDNGGSDGGGEIPPVTGQTIYAAPDGRAAGGGTIDSPVDIYTAVARVQAGGTIYLRGGVYMLTKGVDLDQIGTESRPYRLWACEGEIPVFDCSEETVPDRNNVGVRMTSGQWWHIRGLVVCNAYNSGFKLVNASHNTFENCTARHNGGTGFHIGYDHETQVNSGGTKAAYNTFLNCDSHHNFDWWTTDGSGNITAGTNTDGFACKANTGKGNRYIGCRAWANSDDGWDLFECGYGVQLIDCWTWSSGVMEDHLEMYRDRTGGELTPDIWDGNGNGFKIGGGCLYQTGRTCRLESRGTHILRGCVSFANSYNGFDQNNHRYGAIVEHCMAFDNQRNFQFYDPNKNGTKFTFRNNVSWGGEKPDNFTKISLAADEGNLWNQPGITQDPAREFVSLTAASAGAGRGADGSLPDGFARLTANSAFVDKGVATQGIDHAFDDIRLDAIPYQGAAPDLGPIESKQVK